MMFLHQKSINLPPRKLDLGRCNLSCTAPGPALKPALYTSLCSGPRHWVPALKPCSKITFMLIHSLHQTLFGKNPAALLRIAVNRVTGR